MNDSRLRVHDFGFLEVIDTPSSEDLKAYYAEHYYQAEQGNYRNAYSDEERAFLNLKIAQKASIVSALRGNDTPGSLLDVGCGEGFTLNVIVHTPSPQLVTRRGKSNSPRRKISWLREFSTAA